MKYRNHFPSQLPFMIFSITLIHKKISNRSLKTGRFYHTFYAILRLFSETEFSGIEFIKRLTTLKITINVRKNTSNI